MFLRHIRMRNVRSIHALDLPLRRGAGGRPWTYLLGENGLGKTTVLRSAVLALSGGNAVAELVGDPDSWIRLGTDNAEIEVEFATADGQPRAAGLRFRRGAGLVNFLADNSAPLEQLEAAIDKADRNYFIVGYGVTRRTSAEPLIGTAGYSHYRTPRAQSVATLFSNDASLVSLEQWAMDMEYRRGEAGLATVKKAFDALLKDVAFAGIDKERRQLKFKTADGILPLGALSDGYQAMAAWCGDLLFRITATFKDRKDPLKARGLLLIDELDLHLHPTWQRLLVVFLKETFPNLQVIASTHSPLTVHQAGEGELFVLRRAEDGATLEPYPGAPNRLLLPQLIESPMFGLDTLDSPQVAEMRKELRTLQGIGEPRDKPPTGQKKRRITNLTKQLADVPNWNRVPPYLERTNKALEEVARHLAGGPDDPNPVNTVVERSSRSLRTRRQS
jgi:predicted ATPase